MSNLAEALPAQQARVRDLIEIYKEIGPPGAFAIAMMRQALARAEQAAAAGNVVEMLRAHEELKGFKE